MISAIRNLLRDKCHFILPAIRAGMTVVKHQLSRRQIRHTLKERSPLFLELGAGDKKGEGEWVTIDITPHCDIFWDLRKGLPFPDESIAQIYSSHLFEHFSFKEGQKLLDECRRALIPGGKFSISVPNARLYIEAYMNADALDEDGLLVYKPAYYNTTRIDYVNYIAYMDGCHRYMFDEENILHILETKGFKNAHLRQFSPSIDLKERKSQSIYAEAEK